MLEQSSNLAPLFPHTTQTSTPRQSQDEETISADMKMEEPNQPETENDTKSCDVSVELNNSEIRDASSILASDSLDEESDERSKSEDITDFSEKDPSKSEAGEVSFVEAMALKCDSKKTGSISKRRITPKQLQNRLEMEKKRQEKQKEREEIIKKKKEEKERIKRELLKKKEEIQREKEKKNEERQKQRMEKEEQKKKEKEEREQKRREKEEKEEQKRKERELEMLKKQQETEEKRKEQEKKEKSAAAFKNFFLKKQDKKLPIQEIQKLAFKPFELKSGMALPPSRRVLTPVDINNIDLHLQHQTESNLYLNELRGGKPLGKSSKTQPREEIFDDDIMLVETDLGETNSKDQPKLQKYRAKFLKFHDNRRPPYYGTWRKKTIYIKSRKPFAKDSNLLNYEQDSDDEWEEEEQGESLEHSEDETDKDMEDKDDYEVDNDFFVPHGHLSDDEMDEEGNAKLSPEHQKQKLELLKDEFEKDRNAPHKLKPRSIGCVWYNKNGDNVDPAIDKLLKPYAVLYNAPIKINVRSDEYIPLFIKAIHGNVSSKQCIIDQFLAEMESKGVSVTSSKNHLLTLFKKVAVRKRVTDKITKNKKLFWWVAKDVLKSYGVNLNDKIKK